MGVCSCSWLPGLILAWPSMAVAIAWQWRVTNSKQKGKKTGEQIFLKKSNLELSLHWPYCQVRLSCSGLKVWKGLGHLTTLQHWGGGGTTHSILRQTWDFGLVISTLFYMDMDFNCFFFQVSACCIAGILCHINRKKTTTKKLTKKEHPTIWPATSFSA